MYQRFFFIGLIGAAALIILILAGGAFYEYQIKPNQVIAKVNGEEITRRDYWKYQNVTLYNQARMYEDYALQVTGQQQTQFLMYSAQFDQMREDVWGSTDVSEATVQQMIEDRLYVAGAEDMGIDLSQPVLEEYALNTFAPEDAPIMTPVPTPTMIPTRAAWATETQQALATQEAQAMGTPVGTPAATPVVDEGATPYGTPDVAAADTSFSEFQDDVLDDANMSYDEYLEVIIKPQVARDRVETEILNDVPQVAEQVEVQHILVATEDLANATYEQVTSGASFDEVAKTTSVDSISAPTGGKLGWITRDQMSDAFTEAAFNTEPGQVAEPVQTEHGWHIIKVTDKDPERAMSETQYNLARTTAITEWLDAQREQADISSDHYEPTPEPTQAEFYPPADAPTPVVATPVPAPDLSATPIAGPQLLPDASPVASPGAGTPGATPEASPAG